MSSQTDNLERPRTTSSINGVLEFFTRLLLTAIAIAIAAGAAFVMVKMGESARNQGGRYLVAVGAFVLLIGVDTQFTRLAWRRFQLGLTPPGGYQRYTARATLALVFAAVFLFALALFLP
jgi:magnesium-transporting ATPase (P-type)